MGHRPWQRRPARGGGSGCFLFVEFPGNGTLRLDGVRLSHSLACGEHLSLFEYVGKGSESRNVLPAPVLFHGGV